MQPSMEKKRRLWNDSISIKHIGIYASDSL
jgi:hypothetical protein